MKEAILKILGRLRIFDEDGTLSISTLIVLVVLVRVAVFRSSDWGDLSAFLLALLNYNARKGFRLFVKMRGEAELDRIAKLEAMVRELRTADALKR